MIESDRIETVISVIIPAYNEADVIASTVRSARSLPGVSEVIVVDDGSSDDTVREAESAGATKVIRQKHKGKGAALNAGVASSTGQIILMLDADLGETACQAEALVQAVSSGGTDVAIASFPNLGSGGGFGIATRVSRNAIERLTGQKMASPLSGQRAFRRKVIEKIGGFAPGFAAETAMTIDAQRAGFRVTEIPLEMTHRRTGKTVRGFLHRGKQLWDISRAVLKRSLVRKNFRGDYVPIRGHWLVLAVVCAYLIAWNLLSRESYSSGYLRDFYEMLPGLICVVIGMGCIGFLDDIWGSREEGGFLGHFGTLMREHKLTTGVIKVILGGIVALCGVLLAYAWGLESIRDLDISPYEWIPILFGAGIIALSANTINLFDLRPGRALAVSIPGLVLVLLLFASELVDLGWRWGTDPTVLLLPPIIMAASPLIVVVVFWLFDSRGKVMLGDSGSNALGAIIGYYLALSLILPFKMVILCFLILIHIYSEKRSISATIEANRVLRWIDRRLGVR